MVVMVMVVMKHERIPGIPIGTTIMTMTMTIMRITFNDNPTTKRYKESAKKVLPVLPCQNLRTNPFTHATRFSA